MEHRRRPLGAALSTCPAMRFPGGWGGGKLGSTPGLGAAGPVSGQQGQSVWKSVTEERDRKMRSEKYQGPQRLFWAFRADGS